MHQHFQKSLVSQTFPFRDPAGLCEIRFRQTERNLNAPFAVEIRYEF
jgi:hypothetical protein